MSLTGRGAGGESSSQLGWLGGCPGEGNLEGSPGSAWQTGHAHNQDRLQVPAGSPRGGRAWGRLCFAAAPQGGQASGGGAFAGFPCCRPQTRSIGRASHCSHWVGAPCSAGGWGGDVPGGWARLTGSATRPQGRGWGVLLSWGRAHPQILVSQRVRAPPLTPPGWSDTEPRGEACLHLGHTAVLWQNQS